MKSEQKLSYQEQKEFSKKVSKLKRDIVKLEEKLEKITTERKSLNIEYEKAGQDNDLEKLMKIQEQFDKFDEDEMQIMEEWEIKSEELSELEK